MKVRTTFVQGWHDRTMLLEVVPEPYQVKVDLHVWDYDELEVHGKNQPGLLLADVEVPVFHEQDPTVAEARRKNEQAFQDALNRVERRNWD